MKNFGLLELQPDVLKIPQRCKRFNGSIFTSQTGWCRFLTSINSNDLLTYIYLVSFIYLMYLMLTLLNIGFHIINFYPSILSISILINKLLTIHFPLVFFDFLLFSLIFILIFLSFRHETRP